MHLAAVICEFNKNDMSSAAAIQVQRYPDRNG